MKTSREVREWLDKQIKATKLMNEELIVNEDGDYLCNLSKVDKIHLQGEAVRYISEKLGIPMYVKARKGDEDYPYEIALMYEGYLFFALESEAQYQERGAVV